MSTLTSRIEQLSPLQRAVFALQETQARLDKLEGERNEPIAIVGMACRFPGNAIDPSSYWRLLCEGVDAIGEVPRERWNVDAYYDPDPQSPGKMNCRRGGFLQDVDRFDNHFFGISEEEGKLLDPQQRMLLELTWEALEDAGVPPESLRGTRTGVFLGISVCEYSSLMSHNLEAMGPLFSTGTAPSIAANRISFVYDFHGPSVAVDTACSSSLVALHLASQAIRNGECTTAIVAGTNLIVSPVGNIILTKSGMSSPDGRVRAFDRSANGYVRSEGAGVLVLKARSAAVATGDRPYAFIRGSAVSQTGRANGLSAPVGTTQEATLRAACSQAKIAPGRIAYVETQGTGTLLGDAIEAKALGAALSDGRQSNQACPIGSVKTNLGHLEAASGIASVMKVALSLKHRQLPASLHFDSPNPMIPFEQLRLRVPISSEPFAESDEPLVASVNGFGYGGSTVHVVLEAATSNAASTGQSRQMLGAQRRLLPISARTDGALHELAASYRDYFRSDEDTAEWSDICGTALHRRDHHDCRLAIVASSREEAAEQIDGFLRTLESGHSPTPSSAARSGRRPFGRQEVRAAVRRAIVELQASEDPADALAGLYLAGGDVELRERDTRDYNYVRLPQYTWQRNRLWTEEPNPYQAASRHQDHSSKTARVVSSHQSRPRPDLNVPYVAPESELQSRIVLAWSSVLQVDPIGIHDNFFELGGKSLQAAMLINEVQKLAGVQLELIALFELQTVHDLAAYLLEHHADAVTENLARDASALVEATAADAAGQIPRALRSEPFPLSFGQHRFWFMDQLNPGAAVYNTHLTVPLHGPLDPASMQYAWSQVMTRHESLRTTIETIDGQTSQQIRESFEFAIEVLDLTMLSEKERLLEVRRLSDQQARTAFLLDEFPLFRLKLLRLGESEHVLLLTVHHIIIDGVSLAILLRDVIEIYEAKVAGRNARLPELPIQYGDFAVWQRQSLQGASIDSGLAYWRDKLVQLQLQRLPFDRARIAKRPACPGTHKFTIPQELFERLQSVCRQRHVTPFLFTLAAFKSLLSRIGAQEDIIVGVPVAGRSRPELSHIVGFFVNTLALRTNLAGDPKFDEVLEHVRDVYFEGLTHQDVPFDRLAKEVEPDRDPLRHPVFQVLFNYLQQVQSVTSEGSHSLSVGRIPTEQPPHGGELDLVLTLAETNDSLDAIIGFNAAIFEQATIERICAQFIRLLDGVTHSLDQTLSSFELLDQAERQRLLVEWNNTQTEFSSDKCLHELVESQVERTPERVAVRDGECQLTFDQLNRRANQVAHFLRQQGAVPDQLVGVCLPRSTDAIVALLGILKSGAAFLPIDETLPHDRIAAMLSDADVPLVLTRPECRDKFADVPVELVQLEDARLSEGDSTASNLDCVSKPHDLAYAIFTSGSTGRPKGVLIEHRSIVNVVECLARSYKLDARDRILQNTSLSFDVSINEIFPALCSGATIVVSDDETQADANKLARLIRDQHITIAAATPTMLSHLNRQATESDSLRLVLSGGEALNAANIDHLLKQAVVTNGYGPTETCIAATCYELQDISTETSIPIGRPLANYRIYIVDRYGKLAPIGCPGELCIAGVGLARGYADDEKLTAEKFVACPFEPGERMYRTGDLARWLPDGNVEFLGRLDRQIKLRGLRIELGEIESALQSLPQIANAAVVNHSPDSGEPRIVAYVVPDANVASAVRTKARLISEGRLGHGDTFEMPNGLEVVQQNDGETEFLYRESFEHNCHLRHGIEVFDGCCVFDVGANIGVFALHVAQRCDSPIIHAFEPIPPIHEKLRLNGEIHGLVLKTHCCGVAERNGHADFVYFPDSGAMSGSFADPSDLEKRIADVESAVKEHIVRATADVDVHIALPDSVAFETFPCEIRTISDIIRQECVEQIDLLKIDVEHGELAVLQGIHEEDWPKIQQVVVEVHDAEKDAAVISKQLRDLGFHTATASVQVHTQSEIVITHVYARRRGWTPPRIATPATNLQGTTQFEGSLANSLRERLPQYMLPTSFEVLSEMPMSTAGKIDYSKLPAPRSLSVARPNRVAPRNATEERLAAIWSELLSVADIGVHDHLFELGGHSLLATQLVARINTQFGAKLRLSELFSHATIAELAPLVSRTSDRRGKAVPIRRMDHDGMIPLSSIQESLWLLEQSTPGPSAYAMNAALRLSGPLNVPALEQAIDEIIRRHDTLRTTYPVVADAVVQRIADHSPFSLQVVDAGELASNAAIDELVREMNSEPIDLESGPVVRVQLLRRSDTEHVMVLTSHHIAFDAWSASVLTREIATMYQTFVNGWRSPLAELPIQYADYAIWQREFLTSETAEELLKYWTNKLADVPRLELPALPNDQREGSVAHHEIELSPDLNEAIQNFCQQQQVTPFMLTLAALQVVLAHHSGQRDFALGTPVSGRTRPETQELIGCFINPLVLRCELAEGISFASHVETVRENVLEAFDHQELPFDRIVEALRPSRDEGHPLFQVLFDFQHMPPSTAIELGSVRIEPLALPSDAAKFDLTVSVCQVGQTFSLAAEYSTAKFDSATVTSLLEHMQVVLCSGVADLEASLELLHRTKNASVEAFDPQELPFARISELMPSVASSDCTDRLIDQLIPALQPGIDDPSLAVGQLSNLPTWEHQRVLVDWNDTQEDMSELVCVHRVFEDSVERAPDAIAVVCEEQRRTYGELNERANQIAHYLRAMGVGVEDLVCMCLDRSVDVPAVAFAIWKAGAVFVPLDPDYPQQRLSLALDDARPRVLITNRRLAEELGYAGPCLILERDGDAIEQQTCENPNTGVGTANTAYVIYTSGSTGKPKGTINHHLALANLMAHHRDYDAATPEDCFLSRCALGFDVFVEELVRPLVTGAKLVLAGTEEYRDPAALVRLIQHHRITIAGFVPAVLKAVLEEEGIERCDSLRCLFVGGDVLTPETARLHKQKLKAQLFNIYGPAETAIWVTSYRCDGNETGSTVSIGRPLRNCRIYILDPHGNPTPIGVEGELFVAGVAVGRGYLGREDLTADKFLPDPFGHHPTDRMYRTGDRARWRADGNIEFLGRRDHQVKIRGVRIEMGDIEAVLRQHLDVRDVAADVRELPDGEKAIVAYLVEKSGTIISIGELRHHVQQHLPAAMRPASYSVIDKLPLSPNGKVDRRQLPAPDWMQPATTLIDSASATVGNHKSTTESQLEGIWREFLNLQEIHVHDNFFELGGHSLMAVKVMARIRSELRCNIPLAKFFTAPTIAQLACEIYNTRERVSSSQGSQSVPKISRVQGEEARSPLVHIGSGNGTPLFIVHGMGGYATNLVPLGRELSDCFDVFTLEAQGPFDERPPHGTIPEMAAHYLRAVRQRQTHGPYLIAGWSMGGTVAWEMCRQLITDGESVSRLVMIDSYPLWGTSFAQRSEFVVARLLENLGAAFADIESLPKQHRWQAMMDRAENYSGIGAVAIRQLIRTCEAHQRACGAYVPEKLDVDVAAFWAREQWGRLFVSKWRRLAGKYASRTVSGNHYSILEPPHVAELAAELRRFAEVESLASRKAG